MSQITYRECLNWFLSSKSKSIDLEGPWRAKMIAEILSSFYKKFKLDNIDKSNEIKCECINFSDYNSNYLLPIKNLSKDINLYCKKYLFNALLHGSLADLTYKKGWSDIDTFFIVNKETCSDAEKILKLRSVIFDMNKYIYQIDNLAHHEYIFITEYDLNNYNSLFLPSQVIQNAKSLFKNSKNFQVYEKKIKKNLLVINRFKDKLKLFKNFTKNGTFDHHPLNGEYLDSNLKKNNYRMYQLKYFLETVMTLPAYYLEAIGQPIEKSKSFCIKDDFKSLWAIVDKSTQIRNLWEKKEKHPYKSNLIPKWVIQTLDKNFHKEAFELIFEMNRKIIK